MEDQRESKTTLRGKSTYNRIEIERMRDSLAKCSHFEKEALSYVDANRNRKIVEATKMQC